MQTFLLKDITEFFSSSLTKRIRNLANRGSENLHEARETTLKINKTLHQRECQQICCSRRHFLNAEL